MKYLLSLILIFGLTYGGPAFSFTSDVKKNPQDSTSSKQFIDENQNGIDDREESGQGKCYKGRRRDRFVDKDGDGICDDREGNIGPRRRHRGGRNENQ